MRNKKSLNVVCICWRCGEPIYEEQYFYYMKDEIWCEDCAQKYCGEASDEDTTV